VRKSSDKVKMIAKTTLIGDIELFKEASSGREIDKDAVPKGNIIYNDLVFTLKEDPGKSFRPSVKRQGSELVVVSNTLFFRASKDAGLKKLVFNLLPEKDYLPLEQLMEQYNFEIAPPPVQSGYVNRFLFSFSLPQFLGLDCSNIRLNPKSNSQEYRAHNCVRYKFSTGDRGREMDFIKAFTAKNGLLRSIDGIQHSDGRFAKYTKQN